ncbi:thermonuclease family protein [Brucella gallinifaecis]|uniref:Nuclease n=1 Tax=Brucella gallinifaecis TaxID=215590 RepID=A0A502BHZ6_9HYPH|nr:hypothetical protein [Brucella gallinifaecis]TPF73895.1 hypothetical protein FHY56_17425 [Brucella gallinifaecis]
MRIGEFVIAAGLVLLTIPTSPVRAGERISGMVVDVIDGDTLKIVRDGRRIRLTGVDACEVSQKAKSPLGQTIDCGTDPKVKGNAGIVKANFCIFVPFLISLYSAIV